jgi:OOP family OmpA-OmpF porin
MEFMNKKQKQMKQIFTIIMLCLIAFSTTLGQTKNLGTNINSLNHEIRPFATKNKLFFVKESVSNRKKYNKQEIWMSERDNTGEWGVATRLPDALNTQRYNAVYWASEDGNTVLIRGTYDENTKQIYRGFATSTFQNGEWSKPIPVIVNDYNNLSRGIYTGAVMSSDQRVLIMYFSNEKNAESNDLWISILNDSTAEYSKPVKLNISTDDYDEFSAYLASDNKTLFFASDREGGFGSVDIWMSKRVDSTWMNWTMPVNIGAPFNTNKWDAYFSIADDTSALFSTNKKYSLPGVMGGSDLFSAFLPESFRPEKPVEPIHDTAIITMLQYDTVYKNNICDPLDTMGIVELNKQLKRGKILFDYGSSILRSDAYKTLDIIAKIMSQNPDMKIELAGYGDNLGTAKGNQKQSEERAQSATGYLLSKGIERNRIKTIGYGGKNPVADNSTDYGRQLNRRVEIIIK